MDRNLLSGQSLLRPENSVLFELPVAKTISMFYLKIWAIEQESAD